MAGQSISLMVNNASVDAYLARADDPSAPGVLVLHAWWGLTPFFKTVCDRLAEAGFSVFAPSMFDGKTAATIAEAEALAGQAESDLKKVETTALASLDELRRRAPQGKLGVMGFSFGGAWSLVLSALRPDDIGAVTLFYGIYGGVDFTKCKAAILGHFAENELYDEPIENVRKIEAKMKATGLSVTFHVYPGTGHWFFEEDRPDAYHAESAKLAWDRTLAFMREHLR